MQIDADRDRGTRDPAPDHHADARDRRRAAVLLLGSALGTILSVAAVFARGWLAGLVVYALVLAVIALLLLSWIGRRRADQRPGTAPEAVRARARLR